MAETTGMEEGQRDGSGTTVSVHGLFRLNLQLRSCKGSDWIEGMKLVHTGKKQEWNLEID